MSRNQEKVWRGRTTGFKDIVSFSLTYFFFNLDTSPILRNIALYSIPPPDRGQEQPFSPTFLKRADRRRTHHTALVPTATRLGTRATARVKGFPRSASTPPPP